MDLTNRLSCLFGNEEAVMHRRQMVLLREKILTLFQNSGLIVICSGSIGEGVNCLRSDDDLMFAFTHQSLHVYDSYQEAFSNRAFHMIPSTYSAGFCLLQDTKYVYRGQTLAFKSSKCMREYFLLENPDFHLHGPCASITLGIHEYDIAFCFPCPRWPHVANEWITRRRRSGWPSRDLVGEIVRGGCHVVPIGNPTSPLCDLEWRVSFSLAERSLIHAFNHVQFIVYNLLKLILKRVINNLVPEVLCSYFLKTTLFYTIENTSMALWANDTIDECYRKCLLSLFHFIDTMNCPNYFIPDHNMMRRKVNGSNKLPLLSIVGELMSLGIAGSVLLCEKESFAMDPFFDHSHIECMNDLIFLTGYLWEALTKDCRDFVHIQFKNDDFPRNACCVLKTILTCDQLEPRSGDSCFLNMIIKQVLTLIGLKIITDSVTERNASTYKMLKCGQKLLKVGCNIDVTGRLQLANFMFMTGRFHPCLTIIQSVLSKFAPYVMYRHVNSEAAERYVEVICNNGHSLEYRFRKAAAFDITFCREMAKFAPLPVQIMLALMKYVTYQLQILLNPLCFAYFLQGMCFYHMNNIDAFNISVKSLRDTVRDLRYDVDFTSFSKVLLGYMRILQKEYHSSCRCITSAYFATQDMEEKNTCATSVRSQTYVILLACLLNRVFSAR